MTGFKEGAAGDPYDEDDGATETDTGSDYEREPGDERAEGVDVELGNERTASRSGQSSIPWIYRRSSITDGREKTVQFHMQRETVEREREAKSEIEAAIGEEVQKADIREAAYLVGMEKQAELIEKLREWGYDAQE